MHSGKGHIRGGLLYSDDPTPIQEQSIKPSHSGNTKDPSSELNPVTLNRANHGRSNVDLLEKGARNTSSVGSKKRVPSGSGLMAPSPIGQFESAGKTKSAAQNNPSNGSRVLERIAKGLGLDNFFFGNSRASGSGSQRGIASVQKKGLKNVNKPDTPLKDPKAILQSQLDKYNRQRGLASHLEFGKSSSSLFKGMCEHYKTYARRHQIPNKQNPCTD